MAIDGTVTRLQDGRWSFTWPVGTPPYQIWLDGKELEPAVATESYIHDGAEYLEDAPPLEILNAGETPENQTYPPRINLQFRGIPTAAAYAVEQEISTSTWREDNQIMENGRGYYQHESEPLEDGVTHSFRAIAMDLAANEGVPLAFSIEMVRNPAPPDVVCSIGTSGDVVVSAS